MEKNDFKITNEMYETIFNACIIINDDILEREGKDSSKLSLLDHYIFQASSYIISLIHSKITVNEESFCKCFIYRSLIECIAIINMYKQGDITEESTDLINNYNYILEYNIYKKYKDLDHKQFYFSQIESNFTDAKQVYRDDLKDINSAEFKKLISSSKTPFLFSDYSFDKLIQMYCGDYYMYYRMMSVMIHPNDLYISHDMLNDFDYNLLEARLFMDFTNAIVNYNHKINSKKTLREEIQFIATNEFNNIYLNCATTQKKALYKIADLTFSKVGENTQGYFFIELGKAIESIAIDKTFGFSEIVKCKFKFIIELLSLQYYISKIINTEDTEYKAKLLTKHTRIKLMEIYKIDNETEWLDAYKLYKTNVEECSYEEFKIVFSKSLGFIEDTISINKLVYTFIEDILSNDAVMCSHMKMVYDESQALSHANGYMIISNSGAFMEQSSVIPFVDRCTDFILNRFVAQWMLYIAVENDSKSKKFVYDVKKQCKIFSNAAMTKNKMEYDLKDFKVLYK